jgi:hypothetical protein
VESVQFELMRIGYYKAFFYEEIVFLQTGLEEVPPTQSIKLTCPISKFFFFLMTGNPPKAGGHFVYPPLKDKPQTRVISPPHGLVKSGFRQMCGSKELFAPKEI